MGVIQCHVGVMTRTFITDSLACCWMQALEYRLATLETSLAEVKLLLKAAIQSQQGIAAGQILGEIGAYTDDQRKRLSEKGDTQRRRPSTSPCCSVM